LWDCQQAQQQQQQQQWEAMLVLLLQQLVEQQTLEGALSAVLWCLVQLLLLPWWPTKHRYAAQYVQLHCSTA
jgi:hypothetical protein